MKILDDPADHKPNSGETAIAGRRAAERELSKHGHIKPTGPDGVAHFSFTASVEGAKPVSVQVRTTSAGKARWMLPSGCETWRDGIYILVRLRSEGGRPEFYIVPATTVAAELGRRRGGEPDAKFGRQPRTCTTEANPCFRRSKRTMAGAVGCGPSACDSRQENGLRRQRDAEAVQPRFARRNSWLRKRELTMTQ